MTKSQLHVKQICLPSLILNVRNYEKNHYDADIMIRNFHISHNAPFLPPPPPPPQILHNFCFSFLLGITKEIENNAYVKAWGQIRCIMREVQAAYGILWQGIV